MVVLGLDPRINPTTPLFDGVLGSALRFARE